MLAMGCLVKRDCFSSFLDILLFSPAWDFLIRQDGIISNMKISPRKKIFTKEKKSSLIKQTVERNKDNAKLLVSKITKIKGHFKRRYPNLVG